MCLVSSSVIRSQVKYKATLLPTTQLSSQSSSCQYSSCTTVYSTCSWFMVKRKQPSPRMVCLPCLASPLVAARRPCWSANTMACVLADQPGERRCHTFLRHQVGDVPGSVATVSRRCTIAGVVDAAWLPRCVRHRSVPTACLRAATRPGHMKRTTANEDLDETARGRKCYAQCTGA